MRIFLIGYMGSGKTTIGKIVAQSLGMCFYDTDELIEEREGIAVAEIFKKFGEEKFREMERDVLQELSKRSNAIISTGGGAACFFDNMQLMNDAGLTVYIKLSARELALRLLTTNLEKRPLLANHTEESLEAFIQENLSQRELFYNQAQIFVSGTDEEIACQIETYVLGKSATVENKDNLKC